MASPDDLERFLMPQDMTHATALQELRSGMKLSHWMWWEFPQLRFLGKSKRAVDYGQQDLDVATRFLGHPVLGARLVELCMALMMHQDKTPEAIMGPVDALKLQSMATLFAAVSGAPAVFQDLLSTFYGGMPCPRTKAFLANPQ